jgi:hypothetical protein
MTGESAVEPLAKALIATLLLTSSMTVAEAAVLCGIASLDTGDDSGDNLLLETAKAAVRRRADVPNDPEQALPILPPELRLVLTLASNLRECFVLRILLGLNPKLCCELLGISISELQNALFAALRELAFTDRRACDEPRWS